MTNSRFDSTPSSSLKIKAAFVKYLSLLVFLVGALFTQVNATITVNSTPQMNNDFCGTGSPSLILPIVATSNCGTGTITYQWYIGSTFATATAITAAGTPNYSGWNTSTLNVNNASALGTNTTYFAVATESSGACSDADTLGPFNYVKVATKPVITLTSSFDICEGDEAVFAGAITGPTPAGIITFVWTNTADGGAPVTVQTSGPDTFLVDTFSFTPALTDDQDSINLTANNACGTDSATTSILTVNPKPDVTVASAQSVLQACENDSITVQYTISNAELDGSSGGTPVSWTIVATGDAALTSLLTVSGSGSGLVVVGISPGTLAPGAYSATITTITNTTSTPNCARSVSTNSININVYPEPVVTFLATPSSICSGTGSGTTFSVAVTNAEYLVGASPVSVNWSYTVTEASFTQVSGCAGGSAGLLGTTITGNGNDTTTYTINTTMAVGIYQYTLTGITNTSNACTGTIGADTVIDWRVDPTPDIAVIPTSENACESSTAEGFVISVTNTSYCDTIPGSGTVSTVGWSLPYTTGAGQITDLTSDLPATPLTHLNIGTGSFTTNAGLAVGTYVFNPTTITVDTPASPGCNRDVSSKTFTLTVNPEPTVRFATDTIKMCQGNTDTFYVVIGNAVLNTVDQSWSISYTETGASALSGTPCAPGTFAGILPGSFTGSGNDSLPFVVPANLTPGYYSYTLTGITNTSAGCTGTVATDTTITILVAPRPIITVNPVTKDLCELDQEVFNLSITNSLGCSGIGTTDTANWTITVNTDDVVSDISTHFPSWPMGMGDTTVTVNINTDSSLSPNDHIFDVSVSSTSGSCIGATTRDTFTASVDPRPDVKINGVTADTITIDVCQGTASSFTLDVTNALHNAAAVNWEITYTENSGQVSSSCVGGVTQNLIGGTGGALTGSGNGSTSIPVPAALLVGQYTYTLTNIVNTDGPCTGTVNDTTFGPQMIIINVYPAPTFAVIPDSSEVCENNVATGAFYVRITNAEYCLFPDSLEDADWSITDITDNIISNAPSTITGSGNTTTFPLYNANTSAALTVGSYNWSADSIKTTGLPTNCAVSVSSDTSHILTVNPAPNVRINGNAGPDTMHICEGTLDSFSFEVTNAVLNGVNVNWEITYSESSGQVSSGCDGTITQDIPGASGAYTGIGNVDTTVIVPATLPVGQYTYTVTNMENTDHSCTGLVDSVTSGTQTIIINVYPEPVFAVTPDSSEVCENTIAINNFSVVVTNGEYCLTHSSLDSVDWSISGITNSTISSNPSPITGTGSITAGPYSSNTTTALTEGFYSWDATTIATTNLPIVCSNTSSDSVHILQVNPAPDASFASSILTICEGDTDSLEINITNAELNGNPVNWSFDVSESSGNMTSACIVDAAENASLARDSSGTGDTSLTYYIPGNLVPGVYTYTINNVLNTDKTCSGTSTTSTITVYIYPKIKIDLTPTATAICEGDSTDFDIEVTNARYCSALNTASNNAPWTLTYSDSTASDITGPPLTGSGNSSFTFTANYSGLLSAGVYQFITDTITAGITTPTTANCPVSVPDTFTLTVNPEPVVTFSTAAVTLCEGSTGSFSIDVSNAQYTSGSGTVEADWTVDMIGDSTNVANACASGGSGAALFGVIGTNNLNGTGDTTISVSIPDTLAPGVYTYTLNGVVNTSNTCTGSIGGIPTITIHVYPQPDVDLTTDSLTICENTTATFDLTVTNAEYCATIGGSAIAVNWEITHTDATQSTTPASVWAGSGNMAATTYTVNNGLALTNGGSPYTLDISQIENTTHTCVNTDSFTGTELTVYVNDLPVLTIDSVTTSICDGDAATIYYAVSDVGAAEGWSFTFSTDGGTTNHTVTGIGPVSAEDTTTLGLTPPGVYTVTYSAITNDTTGCIGNTPSNSNITVLTLPDVTSFVNATGTNICSGLSNDYLVTVANAAGKSWEIFFTINGSADTTWTGTGNGTFTRPIPTQYHQDSLGAFDSRPLVIDSIKWTGGAGTPPLCVNSTSITDPNAVLNVMPRPWITLTAPANVCINYTADIDYFVGGVRAADLWDFDWYTTGPADGPNNITGSDTTTGMFTTLPLTPVGTSNVNVPTVTNTSTGCDSSYGSSPWSEDIIVDPPTVPGTLTPNYTICDGDVGPFGFKLAGYTGTVQNWDSSENDGFTWLDIGNTTDTHTVVSPHLTTRYHVVVKSGACPADTSNDVILFVHPQPAAAIVSVNDSICEGSNIDVVLSVSGVPNTHGYSIAYTVTDGTSTATGTWTGTGSSATISETLTNGGSGYTAGTWSVILESVTNTNTSCDTTLTDTATVLVKANPVGSTASAPNDTLCANSGGIVVWDGTVANGYVVAWQKKVGSGAWTTITGSAGDTLEFTSLATTTQYRAVIENAPCTGQAFSSAVTITVLTNNPLAEWDLPASLKFCATATGTTDLTYDVTGTNGYFWTLELLEGDSTHIITGTGNKNDTTFTTSPGRMEETFNVTLVKITISAGTFSCTKNLDNTGITNVTIIDLPTATLNSVTSSVCDGQRVTASVTVGEIKTSQSWKLNYTINSVAQDTTGTGPGTFTFEIPYNVSGGNATQTVALVSIENTTAMTSASTTCTNSVTGSLTYDVKAPTSPGTIAASDSVCYNASGSITQTAASSNGGVITDWLYSTDGGSNWASTGNTSTTQAYSNILTTTLYRAVYTNSPCDTASSNTVVITVLTLPSASIGMAAGNDTICEGATTTVDFTVTNVENGQTFTLYWTEGATNKSMSFTNNASNAHSFTTGVISSNTDITLTQISTTSRTACTNSSLSSTVTITVQENPLATIASNDTRLCHGSTVDFTVTVSNVATTDAWTLVYTLDATTETVTGTGAGTFSFTTTATVTSTSDVLALVSITNNSSPDNCNSTLTESKTIAVDPTTVAGVITETTDTICKGGSTTISQTTAGTGSIIGWEYMAASASSWTGITNSSTTLNVINLQETTSYRAVYQSGLCDTALSSVVTITVLELPSATVSVAAGNDTICAGATTTIDLTVTNVENGQTFTLYWVEGTTNKSMSFTNNATNTHTFTTGAISSTTDITLSKIETTSRTMCSNTSLNSTVTINVQENPLATIASNDSRLCHGSTVDFSVTVSNVATTDAWTLVYTLDATTETVTGTGAGTFSFTTTATVTSTSDVLALVSITNNTSPDNCNSTLTESKTIAVDPTTVAGVITEATDTICKGGSTTISQTTAGTGAIIGWEYMAASGSNWTGISNTNTTLSVINLQETTSYRAIYQSGLCDTAHSNVVTITVLELPVGTLSITAGNDTICAGTTTTIDLTVSNIENGQTFTIYYVEGSTSKSMSFTNNASNSHTFATGTIATTTDITLTRIETTSRTMCTNSNLNTTVTVTVQENPLATIASYDARLCHGSTVDFTVTVSNVATTDAWTLVYTLDATTETVTGTGAGTFSFTTTSTVTSTSDVLALVSITNNTSSDNCNSSLTESVTIAVDPTTVAGVITEATDTICKGGSTTISQTTAGTGVIIGWEYMAASASSWTGITNSSTTLNVINLQETTSYRAVYQSGLCDTALSNVVTITVLELPVGTLSITAGNDTICAGTTTTIDLTVANIENGQTFTIYYVEGSSSKTKSFTNNASNSHTFTTGTIATTTDITLTRIETTSRTMCTNSNLNTTVTVTVQENPLATIASYDARLCHGSTVDFTVTVSNVATTDAWTLVYTLDATTETVTGTGAGTFSFTTTSTVTSTSDVLALVSITNNTSSDNCNTSLTESVTIAVDPTTVAGVIGTYAISRDTIVCKGGSGYTKEFTAGTGSIVKWQRRKNGTTTWVDINSTATTQFFFNLVDTTEYRAVYQSGVCSTDASASVTATPKELPYAEITTIVDDSICAGTTGDFEITVDYVDVGAVFKIYFSEGSVGNSETFTQNASGVHTITSGVLTSTTLIQLVAIEVTSSISPSIPACTNTLTSNGTISVVDLPFASITVGPDTICQGDPIVFTVTVTKVLSTDTWRLIYELEGDEDTITGTGPGSVTWTDNDANTATSAKIELLEILNTSNLGICSSVDTDDWDIYIYEPTVAGVIAEATDTICKGGSTTISQTAAGTGVIVSWEYMAASASNWTGITNSNTTLNVINLQETTSYRAIYKSGVCDTAHSNVVTITVLELPVGTLSITAGNDTICEGTTTTIDLTVSNIENGQTFTIYYVEGSTNKSMSFTNNASNSHTFTTGTISSITDITLTRIETTSRTMCTNSNLNTTVTVTVQDNPLATIASYDVRLCHGSTVDFTVTVSNVATTDAWTLVYTLDGTTETKTGTGAGTFSVTTTKTVTSTSDVLALVSITNNTSSDNCNSSLTESVTIAVDPTTVAGVIGTYAISRDTIVCKGGSGYVQEFTTGTGSIVKWQKRKNGTTTWVDINSTSGIQFFFNLLDTTEYRAVYQSGVCSTDASASVTATPKNLPEAEISTIVDDSICAGTTGDFEITVDYVDVGATFTVTYTEGTAGYSASFTQNASGVHTITSDVLTSTTLIQLVSIKVTSTGSASIPACSNTLTSNGTITVVDLPFASITAGPDTLCQQDKIVFTVTVTNVLSTDNWSLRYELENDEDTITGTGPGSVTWVDTDSNTAESAKIQLIEILNVSNLGICKSVNTDDWDIYIFKPTEPGTILASTDTICKGGNTTISEVTGTPKQGVTVSWEYRPISTSNWTGLTNNNTTLSIVNLQETTDYRAIYKSGVCDTAHSNVIRIQVEELPLATISGSTTICAGDSVDLTVTVSNVGTGQDWEIDYLTGTLSGQMTGTGSGTHTLRVGNFTTNSDVILQEIRTISGTPLCENDKLTNNAQARVNINPRPYASLNSTVSPVCQNSTSSFSFTVSNVKSGDSWTLTYQVDDAHSSSVTTTGKGPGTFTVATPTLTDDKTYVVKFTNILNTTTGCDSSLSSDMNIVVDATTTPGSVASDTTVCYGAHVGTVTHTGGNGSIVRWETSIDNGTSWSTITNTASTYTYTNLTTTTLFRVVKMNGVCTEAATSPVTITVNALPVASISGSDTVCAGESGSLTVTATSTQGEDWKVSYLVGTVTDTISVSGPLTTGTITTGSIKTNTTVTLKKIWMTSGTPQCENNNLTNNATATIEVDDEPNATLISLTDSVCTGSPANGKVNVSDVRTSESWIVYWSINGGTADSVTGTGPGSFNFTTANLTVNASTLRLTRIVNTTTGCEGSPTDQDAVTVSPTTVGGTLTANDTVCKGTNSGTLTLGADAIGTVMGWEYSSDNGSTWTAINNTSSTYAYSNLTVTTLYRVIVKSGACNNEFSSVVTITVNELPVAAIVAVGASNICEGSSTFVALNITNVGAGMDWELKYLQGSSVNTLTGSGPGADTIWTGTLSSTTDITLQSLRITSGSPQCTNTNLTNQYTTTITVLDNPTASFKAYPTDICKGETPTVTIDVDDILGTEAWALLYKVNNGSNITSTGVGPGVFTLANMPQFNTEGPNGIRLISITNTTATPNCTKALSDSITINVDSTSIGGTISGVSIVCKGDGGTLSLSGQRGDIVKWQYSTDGVNYYDIANTSDTLAFANLQTKTWYRVEVMNGVCTPEFSGAKSVDVQELPTVTINNPSIDICAGDSTTVSLSIGNVTSTSTWSINYEENGTAGTYTSGTGTSETVTFGPYSSTTTIEILGITVTNGLGCSNTISEKAVVTVTENPTATITAVPDSLCQGDVLVFTASIDNVSTGTKWELDYEVDGTAGPTKKGTGSGTVTINTGRTVSPTSVKVQLTEIVLDNTLGCNTILNDSAEIKVSPTTVGGTLSPATSTICKGGTATLTLTGETGAIQNWEYSVDNGATWAVLSNTANSVIINNINETTLYRVFVKSGTCTGAYSSTVSVTVVPTPMATVTSSAVVCPGDVATFTLHVTDVAATDGWSVVYMRNGTTVGTPVTGTGSGDFNFTVTGSAYSGNPTLITVELVSIENTTYGCVNNNLNSTATARVTPNPVAAFTATNNCEDSTITFNNTSSIAEGSITTYKWYFGDGDSSVNASPMHAYSSAGTYSVTLVVWSDNGCRGEVTTSIEVYPNPTADFTFSNVCQNETFSATDQSSVASGSITSWFWTFGDGSTSNDQNPTHAYAASGNYDVTLTVVTNNGCSNTVSKQMTVYILPESNFVASPVCEDAPMQFVNASAIGYGTMSYEWNFAGQGASTDKDPVFTFTGFGTFSIELIATSNNGCKDTIVRDVTVYPAPTADFTVADVCIGDPSIFNNTSTVPGTDNIIEHFWDFGDVNFSGLENPTHTYSAAGDYNVTLRVKSNRGCENEVTKVASVIALPDVQLTANGPIEFCDGDSVVLSANGNARTYDWSWDGGTSSNGSVTAKTHGWYKVRITAPPIGCANEDSIFITVHQLPDAKAWSRDKVTQSVDTISRGQSIDLHASGGVTYLWSPTTYLNPSDMADVMAERVDMTTDYTVTVTDEFGCSSEAQLRIVVLDNFDLTVYNAVTPNGDGMNDTWIIENIWAYPKAEVVIFNRYGMEVYRGTGYNNDWDAKYKGNDLPDGPYYYVIVHPDFKDIVYKGVINVIRETTK